MDSEDAVRPRGRHVHRCLGGGGGGGHAHTYSVLAIYTIYRVLLSRCIMYIHYLCGKANTHTSAIILLVSPRNSQFSAAENRPHPLTPTSPAHQCDKPHPPSSSLLVGCRERLRKCITDSLSSIRVTLLQERV